MFRAPFLQLTSRLREGVQETRLSSDSPSSPDSSRNHVVPALHERFLAPSFSDTPFPSPVYLRLGRKPRRRPLPPEKNGRPVPEYPLLCRGRLDNDGLRVSWRNSSPFPQSVLGKTFTPLTQDVVDGE